MTVLKVALIQQSCGNQRDANLEKSCGMVRQAAASGARLIVLQELHTGTYFCQAEDPALFDLAETIPGPSSEVFGNLLPNWEL
jgi:N-carbamoylputrescine amidase